MRAWVVTLLAGCYAPSPATGVPCGTSGACPDPLVCAPSTNTCERTRGGELDAPAPTDASEIDAVTCTGTHDEDSDGIVDACDNCPGVANADQADTTETPPDGVGNACDPRPAARDRVTFFEAFAAPLVGWQLDPMTTVANDRLTTAAAQGYGEAYAPKMSTDGVVETRYTVVALNPLPPYSGVEVVAEEAANGVEGYRCMTTQNGGVGTRGVGIQTFVEPYDIIYGDVGGPRFVVGDSGVLQFAYGGTLACVHPSDPADKASAPEPEARTGRVGVATQYIGAAFHYLVVYEPAP